MRVSLGIENDMVFEIHLYPETLMDKRALEEFFKYRLIVAYRHDHSGQEVYALYPQGSNEEGRRPHVTVPSVTNDLEHRIAILEATLRGLETK